MNPKPRQLGNLEPRKNHTYEIPRTELWVPLSELYGRQIPFFVSFMALTAFNAGAPTMAALIVLRFFAGSFGSSPLTNAGGVVADMFHANEQGLATALFDMAPFLGPTIGPIAGGFLGEHEGFGRVAGMSAIFTGILWIVNSLVIPKPMPPISCVAEQLSFRNGLGSLRQQYSVPGS
ncbi:hypothetical protein FGADI_12747 [Fusarium gaditjirri]|uniref:Major facilitator superfamily (MFS) profile domain-containing protein n=1 Tax=Fusarium gaditjirri TaxID=282569 RepID=A0A8H4WNT6_9HYPO|nr:hypothetical protein FGADI_12747 [Fusarium gaditjirri]